MSLFAAIFEEPISAELMQQIEAVAASPIFQLSEHVVLIRSYIDNPQGLSQQLGMPDQPERVGVVLKLNGSYFGYYRKQLWDWLSEQRP